MATTTTVTPSSAAVVVLSASSSTIHSALPPLASVSSSTSTTTPQPPRPPSYLRIRRTIARTLFGAVYECEQPDDLTLLLSPPSLRPSSPLRHRASLGVKTLSLSQAEHATKYVSSRRAVDDPWQEWSVAAKLRTFAEAPGADEDTGCRHVLGFHQQLLLPEADTMVFVTEYCADGDLFRFLNDQPTGVAAPHTALTFVRQIALGLRFLHAQLGVAHRDLSLENVLLHDGVCKIADFALSTNAHEPCRRAAGKEYYMAPEVVATALTDGPIMPYDPCAADVWSLGIVLFILLTGSPLLEVAARSERGFASLASHGVVPVLCAWGVRTTLSDASAELLDGMLQVDPSKRLTVDAVLAHAALQPPQEL